MAQAAILVVDDDPPIRRMLQRTLEAEGFEVEARVAGLDAWHGFLRSPADWAPVVRALWVCTLYIGVPLLAGYLVFLRRDVAGE